MFKIFICEDNEKQLKKIKDTINKIIIIENYDMNIEIATQNPYEILEYLKNNNELSAYFLDVDLNNDINGLKLAENIRKYDPRGFIIFVTSHAEMSYLTFLYKVEALDFIIKDEYEDIHSRVKKCLENINEKYANINSDVQKIYSITTDDKVINIDYNKILFFETANSVHKVRLVCIDRQIEFYGRLKEIMNTLDERFCRCHNSFIVNKENIKTIDKKERIAHMVDGQRCYISTRGIKELL